MDKPDLLTTLLRDVSRSFYLTMRVLPGAIRTQVGLAYLLARATDTIADTEIVPVADRLAALGRLRERILGTSAAPLNLTELARFQGAPSEKKMMEQCETALREIEYDKLTDPQKVPPSGSSAERTLLERLDEILALLENFSADDRGRIRDVLTTITAGQELDLQRFGAGGGQIIALQTEAELDDYTWRVAGCVGEFWTRMCRAHLFPSAPIDETRLLQNGIRFGQGLQLVNILRDLPADLRQGRCYLPAETLSRHGLAPADLLRPANEPRFRPAYQTWLAQADAHLEAGWAYTNQLPRSCFRVRLACAWPILIGVKTLARMRAQNILDASRRIKISRAEVRALMVRSFLSSAWPGGWAKMYRQARLV